VEKVENAPKPEEAPPSHSRCWGR